MGLRKRFQQNTRLHRQIGRLIHRVLTRWTASQIGCHRNRKEEREKARPGIIMAVQTCGAGLKSLQIETARLLESWPLDRATPLPMFTKFAMFTWP